MIRLEIQLGLEDLREVNPFANAILKAGVLEPRNVHNANGPVADHRLNFDRLFRDQAALTEVLEAASESLDRHDPQAFIGLTPFGENFARSLSREFDRPVVRVKNFIRKTGREFFPANPQDAQTLSDIGRVAVITGQTITKERLAGFVSFAEQQQVNAKPLVLWRKGNFSQEVALPVSSLPQYLVEHHLPAFIKTKET